MGSLNTFDWKAYRERLAHMNGPVSFKDRPRCTTKVDWRGLIAYAKAKGVQPAELPDEEKALFVEGGIAHIHDPELW